jgi:hypothetical protein
MRERMPPRWECLESQMHSLLETKQLIWRASAEDTLSDKAEENEKNLEQQRHACT